MALDRRFLLRGFFQGSAAMMALPLLDCFLDGNGQALAATGKAIPVRFGTFFLGLRPDQGAVPAQVHRRRL